VTESELYPEIGEWFRGFLRERHRRSEIKVYDTSRKLLSSFIYEQGLVKLIPLWDTFEIQVDITGVILGRRTAQLAFIECKTHTVSLKDISQLLGYSLVAKPLYSLLISTKPVSASVWKLVETFNNLDILRYDSNRLIRVYIWNASRREVEVPSVLPTGMHQISAVRA
jgi:hypothetical protein